MQNPLKKLFPSRQQKRAAEREAGASGKSPEHIVYENFIRENTAKSNELVDQFQTELRKIGFTMAAKMEYLPYGIAPRAVCQPVSFEEWQASLAQQAQEQAMQEHPPVVAAPADDNQKSDEN